MEPCTATGWRVGVEGGKRRVNLDQHDLRRRLANPETRQSAAIEAGNWVKDLCLLLGASLDTSFCVGGVFAQGLNQEWSNHNSQSQEQQP